MRILCFGNLILDRVHLIEPASVVADKWLVSAPILHIGGQAFNAARTLSDLGHDVAFAGSVGPPNDVAIHEAIAARGVDLSLAENTEPQWRQANIYVDPASGARRIFMQSGRAARPPSRAMEAVSRGDFDAVYVDGYDREAARALVEAAACGEIPRFADFEYADDLGEALIEACTHVLFSAQALCDQTGQSEPSAALEAVSDRHRVVASLDGAGPIYALCPNEGDLTLAPHQITPIDTTGAGDHFRAGFVHATLAGQPTSAALRFARDLGAEACNHAGPSIPPARVHALSARAARQRHRHV